MAKNAISEYSSTAASNQDVGGIGIVGSSPVSNFDDALRELMAQLANMNAGTSPLDATLKLKDPSNSSRRVSFSTTGLPASDTPLPLLPLSRGGSPKVTSYTSSGTHTFTSGSTKYQIIAVGGGGAGRPVYCVSASGTYYATGSGGQSGQFSYSGILDIGFDGSGVAKTGAVVIGAGGTNTVDSAGTGTAVNGGSTTWTHDGLSLTALGGNSSQTPVTGAQTVAAYRGSPGRTPQSGWLYQGQNLGGISISGIVGGVSGSGGSSPFGCGGQSQDTSGTAGSTAGVAGAGYGAGGGGAIATATTGLTRYADGGAGSPGILIVMEW